MARRRRWPPWLPTGTRRRSRAHDQIHRHRGGSRNDAPYPGAARTHRSHRRQLAGGVGGVDRRQRHRPHPARLLRRPGRPDPERSRAARDRPHRRRLRRGRRGGRHRVRRRPYHHARRQRRHGGRGLGRVSAGAQQTDPLLGHADEGAQLGIARGVPGLRHRRTDRRHRRLRQHRPGARPAARPVPGHPAGARSVRRCGCGRSPRCRAGGARRAASAGRHRVPAHGAHRADPRHDRPRPDRGHEAGLVPDQPGARRRGLKPGRGTGGDRGRSAGRRRARRVRSRAARLRSSDLPPSGRIDRPAPPWR